MNLKSNKVKNIFVNCFNLILSLIKGLEELSQLKEIVIYQIRRLLPQLRPPLFNEKLDFIWWELSVSFFNEATTTHIECVWVDLASRSILWEILDFDNMEIVTHLLENHDTRRQIGKLTIINLHLKVFRINQEGMCSLKRVTP